MAPRQQNKNRRPRQQRQQKSREEILAEWHPKTDLGHQVKNKDVTTIDYILDRGMRILEPEIVDALLELEIDLLLIGQSKGKFGGGQRRVFRQTQKKTMEGNKPKFSALAVVGNKDGYIGLGFGKSKETIPAREKAIKNAKMNLFRIRRGAGSWEDASTEPHSIPMAVEGKCGSVIIKLMPAPKGKGLICEKEIAKILALAGIKDVWSKTIGQTKNKVNLVKATESALRKLSTMKIKHDYYDQFSIIDGETGKKSEIEVATEADEEEFDLTPDVIKTPDEDIVEETVKKVVERPVKKAEKPAKEVKADE